MKLIATGIHLSKKENMDFGKCIGSFNLLGNLVPTSMGLVHYDINNDFFVVPLLSYDTPKSRASNLYEAYANEELIFEWQDFDARRPILEFLGMGGDYFSLMGCTSLKIRAILLYQIESYFWDLECADWSDVLYQSYVIKPLEILEIKSKFVMQEPHYSKEIEVLLTGLERYFEIHNLNKPTRIFKDKEALKESLWQLN
ncbi:hypothetical protein BBW65_05695 [Helicobacter enhydrae]|uniref:Uncharacterized protein n=1 Tax=Helicobacter enhydrae TaxID=222136 RepID=A0A1B1U6J7_9HELI|nr:hypothetical protein [Helicobacter enhydrae]ANV98322.1 hypothetical protein BBW65_05695 [Helicobacter enhydrae]